MSSSWHGERNAEIPSPWSVSRKESQQCHWSNPHPQRNRVSLTHRQGSQQQMLLNLYLDFKAANGVNKPFLLIQCILSGPSIPEAHLRCAWSSHSQRQALLHGASPVADDTRIPRVLLSQAPYIQPPFLLTPSERHMTSRGLGMESLVYAWSETVNEMFCFFILISAFMWLRISQVLSSSKDRSGNLRRTLIICHFLVTLTYGYFLQHGIKTKRIRKMNGKILLIHFSYLNKKTREFCQRKEYLWTSAHNLWLQKGHVLWMSRTERSSNLILIIRSNFLLYQKIEVEWFYFYCFSPFRWRCKYSR